MPPQVLIRSAKFLSQSVLSLQLSFSSVLGCFLYINRLRTRTVPNNAKPEWTFRLNIYRKNSHISDPGPACGSVCGRFPAVKLLNPCTLCCWRCWKVTRSAGRQDQHLTLGFIADKHLATHAGTWLTARTHIAAVNSLFPLQPTASERPFLLERKEP